MKELMKRLGAFSAARLSVLENTSPRSRRIITVMQEKTRDKLVAIAGRARVAQAEPAGIRRQEKSPPLRTLKIKRPCTRGRGCDECKRKTSKS